MLLDFDGSQRARNGHETEEGNNLKKDNTRSRAGEPEGFAEWYTVYPRKKQPIAAAKAFAKIMASGQITLADLLKRTLAFAQSQQGKDRQFIPYPATWLNAGGYKDEPDAATTTTSPGAIAAPERDPRTFTDDEWCERLAASPWSPTYWGPPPGQPGCLVPVRLLVAPAESTRTTGAANG